MWLSFTKVLMCFMGIISLGIEPWKDDNYEIYYEEQEVSSQSEFDSIENRLAGNFKRSQETGANLYFVPWLFLGAMKRPAAKRPAARIVKKKPAGKTRTDVFQNKGCAGFAFHVRFIDSLFFISRWCKGPMHSTLEYLIPGRYLEDVHLGFFCFAFHPNCILVLKMKPY